MSVGDLANVVTALIAAIALGFGWYTFSRQKTASDVTHVLEIFQTVNSYWDRLNDASKGNTTCPNDLRYNIGQILAYFEVLSYLINSGVISNTASDIMSSHVEEIWNRINEREDYKGLIEELTSTDKTFEQTRIFVQSRLDVRTTRKCRLRPWSTHG